MTTTERLLEADMKAALIGHLKEKEAICPEKSVLINELTIDNFSGRVDLVVADDKGLYAYEIKSEADSLYRLKIQISRYLQFFDKVTIFAATKHVPHILKIAPETVAVWAMDGGKIKIVQRGRRYSNQQVSSLLKLMKASELRSLALKIGKTPEAFKRSFLEVILYDVSRAVVRQAVINALKSRYRASSRHFWQMVEDTVGARHIVELSPYLTEKRRIENLEAEQEEFWLRWSADANRLPDDPSLLNLFEQGNGALFGDVPQNIKALLAS